MSNIFDDNRYARTYGAAVGEAGAIIELTINVDQPIELGDFVRSFTALASEYERFAKEREPDTRNHATLYVSQVRQGSIIADLVPALNTFAAIADHMGHIVTVEDFVRRYGGRLLAYARAGGRVEDASKQELKDFNAQVAAIANHPGSTLEMAAIDVRDGKRRIRAAFKFNTTQARMIQDQTEIHAVEIEHANRSDHERVLMVFTRSDVGTPPVGQGTGERVRIESLSTQSRPLIYASDLAESAIKHHIVDAEENVFKKGFVVDVNVENRNGKPWAYRVTALHQVIDIDDD